MAQSLHSNYVSIWEKALKINIVKRLLQGVHSVEFVIAAFGLVVTNLLMFVQVLNRYWLHLPLLGIGDFAFYCFIIFMSVAALVATWSETHVAVDALRDQFLKFRPVGLKIHSVVVIVICIAILLVFLPNVATFMEQAIRYPKWATLVRWFNLSWLFLVWGFCMFMVCFHFIEVGVKHAAELRSMLQRKKEER